MKNKSLLMILGSIVGLSTWYLQHPIFGRKPSGKRQKKILKSRNYYNGQFNNIENTPVVSEDSNSIEILSTLFSGHKDQRPKFDIPHIRTNLKRLSEVGDNYYIWFGHSSYLIQISGVKYLIDPVFSGSVSPVPGSGKAFKGADYYDVEMLPEKIDYLIISHDHYDHLDYITAKYLKDKVGKVVVPLGVGEHFEYWGYSPEKIIELSWDEENHLEENVKIISVPSRHASGRLFPLNKTLWTSYILYVDGKKIFLGGDSSYGKHFKKIREKYGEVDIAILENGQYNKNWKYSHLFPEETLKVSVELGAKYLIPVHNSKFTLAPHAWYEPLRELVKINDKKYKVPIITPMIGEVIDLDNLNLVKTKRWFE